MMLVNGPTAAGGTLYRTAVGSFDPVIDASLGGYTVIGKMFPLAMAVGGTGIRLILRGPVVAGHSCSLSNVTISLAANTSGSDLYDSSASPTAVTFGGSASLAMARGGIYVSDDIAFAIDRTRPVLIAYNIASGTQWVPLVTGLSGKTFNYYTRAATTQAATTNRTTGYAAAAGISPFLGTLQCR